MPQFLIRRKAVSQVCGRKRSQQSLNIPVSWKGMHIHSLCSLEAEECVLGCVPKYSELFVRAPSGFLRPEHENSKELCTCGSQSETGNFRKYLILRPLQSNSNKFLHQFPMTGGSSNREVSAPSV